LLGTKVTISSNVFRRHDKTNLLGGNDIAGIVPGYGPGKIDVTFHCNYFQNTVQRMPRVRFGRVHVFNNYYQVERNQNIPGTTTPVDYRVTDAWILGTASKLVTEHNLFDITNNSLTPPRIINYSSTLANRQFCIDTGFTAAACGTYYRDEGTIIKMIRTTVTPNTTATVLYDAFQAALGVQQANAGAAPLLALDPADPGVFWLPSHSYPYVAGRIDTSAQQEMLRQRLRNSTGAGKL
jgi:pectate lyase